MTISSTTIPNLRDDERGYNTGNVSWPLARVRVTPIQVDPSIGQNVNGPVAPIQICVQLSTSLVDSEGAVLTVGGRYLILDASRHSYVPGASEPFNPSSWFASLVEADINKLTRIADDLTEAEAAGFLASV